MYEAASKHVSFSSLHASKVFRSQASSSSVMTFGNNESEIFDKSESLGMKQLFPKKSTRTDLTNMLQTCQEQDKEKDSD